MLQIVPKHRDSVEKIGEHIFVSLPLGTLLTSWIVNLIVKNGAILLLNTSLCYLKCKLKIINVFIILIPTSTNQCIEPCIG